MNRRVIYVITPPTVLLCLFLLTPKPGPAQELTAEQRRERCRTNEKFVTEYEYEARNLERDLAWTDAEKIARARTQLAAIRRIKTSDDPSEQGRLRDAGREHGFDWDACITTVANRLDQLRYCASKLEVVVGQRIDRAVSARRRRAEMEERKAYLERQIAFHRSRLDQLNCEESQEAEAEETGSGNDKYLGCFLDNNTADRPRDLSGLEFKANDMTIERCVGTCKEKGFAYAATQHGAHCFCGDRYGRYGKLTSSSARRCDMACSGNPNQICGGAWANSVYRTGN